MHPRWLPCALMPSAARGMCAGACMAACGAGAMRASPRLCPSAARAPQARFLELLRLRYSSPLLRLPRAEHIQRQLGFLNTGAQQARAQPIPQYRVLHPLCPVTEDRREHAAVQPGCAAPWGGHAARRGLLQARKQGSGQWPVR
jgi:hypothetical protein